MHPIGLHEHRQLFLAIVLLAIVFSAVHIHDLSPVIRVTVQSVTEGPVASMYAARDDD